MKNTRRSLITSLVTLLLCSAMFVGSSFAWFTDTVSNTGNKIQAGTLDIGLEQFKKTTAHPDGEWVDLKQVSDPVFNYDKWEPGYSDGGVFKIVNKGNLALKYTLQVAMTDGTLVVNDKGHSLADVIDVYFKEDTNNITMPDSFVGIKAENSGFVKVGTLADIIKSTQLGGFAHGVLLPAENKKAVNSELPAKYAEEVKTEKTCVAIVLHMQEEAGNEYQGMSLGTSFDIRLLATQVEFEKDGFNSNLYDEQSIYPLEASADYDSTKDTTITIYDGDNKLEAKATIPTGSSIPEGTEKIVMIIDNTEKPEVIELAEDENSLNVDISFYSVKSDGTKTQITDFGTNKYASVDLSTVIPDGNSLERVYNTHNPENPTLFIPVASKEAVTDGRFYYDSSTKTMYLASSKFSPFTFVMKLAELKIQKDDGLEETTYMSLGNFRDNVNNGNDYEGYTITVLKDLDYTDEQWISIGERVYGLKFLPFYGKFNGDNHTIKVKNINITPNDYFGFFGLVINEDPDDTKRIYNLNLEVEFVAKEAYTVLGGLIGETYGFVDIENVNVTGSIKSTRVAGGLIGNVCVGIDDPPNSSMNYQDKYLFKNCTISADVSAYSVMTSNNWLAVGGIVGQNDSAVGLTIDNCNFTGKLETFFDEEHQSEASSYMGYALAKGANDGGKEVTTINNFTVGDGSSIVGYQNIGTHGYPFEGLNKYTNQNTYTGEANPNKELLGGYFYKCTIDDVTTGGSGQQHYPHGSEN